MEQGPAINIGVCEGEISALTPTEGQWGHTACSGDGATEPTQDRHKSLKSTAAAEKTHGKKKKKQEEKKKSSL